MFLRLVRATVSKGVKREYVRVVEAYRDATAELRHHTIINLGRRDLLARHLDLDKLARLLHGDARADRAVRRAGVAAIGAWDWGPVLTVRQLWNELGLDHVVAQGGGRGRGDGVSLSERALVLVANGLASPGSEHALAQWLETDLSVIVMAGVGSRRGVTKRNARPAGHRACAWRGGNCSSGIARSTS